MEAADNPPEQDEASAAPTRNRVIARMPRQGDVHATILENHGKNGSFNNVDFQLAYLVPGAGGQEPSAVATGAHPDKHCGVFRE